MSTEECNVSAPSASRCYPALRCAMWHFVFPENGQPAYMFNRMLDGPFEDQQYAIEKFAIRYTAQGWHQTPAKEVAFLNQRTGEMLVLRQVTA